MAPGLEGVREDGQGNEGKTPHLTEKSYNATFVYDDKNLPWVKSAVNYLEENYSHRVYYRGRDATPGNPRTTNSTDSIKNSDVIIVAISKDFINNGWGEKERGWAICLSAKKDYSCKLLPVLLDESEVPDELSDLDILSLTSVVESQGEHLEQVAQSVCKLLTTGQVTPGMQPNVDSSGSGADGNEPTDTRSFTNGSSHHHDDSLVRRESSTADNGNTSHRQSQESQLINARMKLLCLLCLLGCKFLDISINILDIGFARIPECLNTVKDTLQEVAMFLTRIIHGFFKSMIETLPYLCMSLQEMLQELLKKVFFSLEIVCKKLKSIVPVFLKEMVGAVRFSGDGSFPTFAGTWIYNASVFSFFGLVLNGLVWQVSGYNVLQASTYSFIPLIPPLVKGFYCMKHMPKYRETIRDMYDCKTLKRKSMKDKMVKANVEYCEVRICLSATFLCEIIMIAIGYYITTNSVHFQVSTTVGNLIPVVVLVLHSVFLLFVIIRYYHDPTVCMLITRRRFLFPDIMTEPGFDQKEKRLLSMIGELDKTKRQKKMTRSS